MEKALQAVVLVWKGEGSLQRNWSEVRCNYSAWHGKHFRTSVNLYNKQVEINEVKAAQGKTIVFHSPEILLDPVSVAYKAKIRNKKKPPVKY
jgi:hypothetical protein